MEARIARLESDVAHLRSDVAEINFDLRSMRDKMDSKIDSMSSKMDSMNSYLLEKIAAAKVWALVLYFAVAGAMPATMARGFGWI